MLLSSNRWTASRLAPQVLFCSRISVIFTWWILSTYSRVPRRCSPSPRPKQAPAAFAGCWLNTRPADRFYPPASRNQAGVNGGSHPLKLVSRPCTPPAPEGAAAGLASLGVGPSGVHHPQGRPHPDPNPLLGHSRVEAQLALVPGALAPSVLAAGRGAVPRHGGDRRSWRRPEPSARRQRGAGGGIHGHTTAGKAPPRAGGCSGSCPRVTWGWAANGVALRVGIAVGARGEGLRECWWWLGGSAPAGSSLRAGGGERVSEVRGSGARPCLAAPRRGER